MVWQKYLGEGVEANRESIIIIKGIVHRLIERPERNVTGKHVPIAIVTAPKITNCNENNSIIMMSLKHNWKIIVRQRGSKCRIILLHRSQLWCSLAHSE